MYTKIIATRASGKTCNLIRQAIQNPNLVCIVCGCPEAIRDRILELGYSLMKEDILILNYEQYIYSENELEEGRDIYIDELDRFLQIYDPMIKGYTLSIED